MLRENGSASLIDIGDGVACLEFHSKMNSIDEGIIEMLRYVAEEGQQHFRAVVIGNEAADFSAGANVMLVLMGAKAGEWKLIEDRRQRLAAGTPVAQIQPNSHRGRPGWSRAGRRMRDRHALQPRARLTPSRISAW